MSTYIDKSFCRGVVPAGIPAFNFERREQLVKMLGTDENVRVITAPSGYGKSALSASFANSKQGFKNTVWLDCLSPCFTRDLCNSEIQKGLHRSIDELSLCVFDDLPQLSENEIETFMLLINFLVAQNVDVVINTSSEAKNFFLKDNFKFRIKPIDMLCEKNDPNSIPALVFSRGSERSIFDSLKQHGLSESEILIYYCMMVLTKGSFSDLEKFGNCRHVRKDLKFLKKAFPHLRIDNENYEFSTAKIDVEDLRAGFNFAIYEIVRASKMRKELDFFCSLTDLLREQGNYQRATDLAKVNLKTQERLKWAVINTQNFSDSNNASKIVDCLRSTPQQMGNLRDEVNASLCHSHYFLGNYTEAKMCARKILRSRKASPCLRTYACLVSLLCCDAAESFDFIEILLSIPGLGNSDERDFEPYSSFKFGMDEIKFIEDFLITWFDDEYRALVFLLQEINEYDVKKDSSVKRDAICVCINYVFRKLLAYSQTSTSLISVIKHVFYTADDKNSVYDLIACLVQFCFNSGKETQGDLDIPFELIDACDNALQICEKLDADLLKFGDGWLFKSVKVHRSLKKKDQSVAKNNELRSYEVMSTTVKELDRSLNPDIRISFFGGLTFEVNGLAVQTNLNRRQNCLYFLYLISRDLGKEVTRDTLIEAIWRGNCTTDANRRNFYNALSSLKRSLIDASGREIVKKNSAGIYLDPTGCTTDLQEFESVCNLINFDVDTAIETMSSVSEKIQRFSEPLLPQITKFGSFETIRLSYVERLIDASIFAAITLLERKDFRNALWFAKVAKSLDRNREDAYYLIMKAQNGLNLRSSAVSTFFECKQVLDEELGIKPSEDIRDLYQMVIS